MATRAELRRLFDKLEGPLRDVFLAAVDNSKSRVQLARLIRAIESADLDAILRFAGVSDAMWSRLTEQFRQAYDEAGTYVMSSDFPQRPGIDFDINNPRSSAWLREHSATLVTGELGLSQRQMVQVTLEQGVAAGRGPRDIALDIVGRVSPQTGRRTGGLVGLTGPQSDAANKARQELIDGDVKYFSRTLRDKRYDAIVREYRKAGKPLPKKLVDKIAGRYSDRLLKHRGDTIGRTEALQALNRASDDAIYQAIDQGLAPPEAITRIWRHSFGPRERPGHREMDNSRRGPNDPFVNPVTGIPLMRPGSGPASEVVNCRCMVEHEVNFSVALEHQRARGLR